MAKNKKSKILAMALCASVMTGIYAAPVMAAEVDVTSGNLTGVKAQGHDGYSFTGGTLYLDDAGIAGALNGQNVNLGVITANSITSTAGITAAGGQFQVYGGSGGIAATSLSLLKDDNGIKSQNVLITNSGMARFGDNGANVRVEDGVLTVNRSSRQVAALSENGLTLTSGDSISGNYIRATLDAEQIARLNKVVTQNGESIVVTADHFKNTKESFAVDSNGAVKAANGKFNVGADGDVAIRYAEDGAIVANENGFAAQKGSAQTVVTNDGVANIYDDNRVEVNAKGVGLAAGLKKDGSAAAQISVTDDGIGLQGGTSEVVLNSNNGAVFTNGEGNGETVINGGSITTNRITTGTVNGVAIGMNDDGDITLGNNVVIDGDFNSDNIAGITRNGNTTTIEGVLNVSDDGSISAQYADDGAIVANENGFAVQKGAAQTVVTKDGVANIYDDNRVEVNANGVGLAAGLKADGSAAAQISVTDAGIGFAGTVYTGNTSDLHFTYDGFTGAGGTNVAAGNYTLDDLVDTVADIYDRTQGITYENGTTTIDGNLDVKGDATTGEGGNLDAGSGTIGDVTMSGGNINTDGVINAGGGGTIGGATVDEAGNINTDGVINAGGGGTIGGATVDKAGNINTDGVINAGGGGTIGGATIDKAGNINTKGVINAGSGTIGDVTMSEGKVTTGQTTVSNDGVSIADKTIISDHDVVINSGTENEVSLSDVGNRVDNLEQGVAELNNRVGELEDRIDKVGAMAAAIANLRTMGYDPAAPTEVAVGIGQYRDETGAALGLFHYPNRDFMLSLSVSTSGDEVMGGIGATWKFGRKSPEKVAEIKKAQAEADARRAEEAKLAKAEEMKQAAKEAKIKAQQERHAKLAAERAAQAEAAK